MAADDLSLASTALARATPEALGIGQMFSPPSYLLLAVTLAVDLALTACEPLQRVSTDAAPPAAREDAGNPVEAADAGVEQDVALSAEAGSVMDASLSSAQSADPGPDAALLDATPADTQIPLSGEASNSDASITDDRPRTGDFPVGTTRLEMTARGGRELTVQVWYPALGQHDSALKPGETALELVRIHGARDAGAR